jgi:hypothetical protein
VRTCQKCGAKIPPQKGSARPRKYCESCRPPRNRPNPRVVQLRPEDPGRHDEHPMVASYRKRLVALGAVDTHEGQQVLLLCTLLSTGPHTAAGAASLSRELRGAMEAAERQYQITTDRVSELEERRRRRAAGL